MPRHRPPNRRNTDTRKLEFGGRSYYVAIGFEYPEEPLEVFITSGDGPGNVKTGQDLAHLIEDASVLISLALQYGITPSELAHSIGRVPTAPVTPANLDRNLNSAPASILGAVIDLLVQMKEEACSPSGNGSA